MSCRLYCLCIFQISSVPVLHSQCRVTVPHHISHGIRKDPNPFSCYPILLLLWKDMSSPILQALSLIFKVQLTPQILTLMWTFLCDLLSLLPLQSQLDTLSVDTPSLVSQSRPKWLVRRNLYIQPPWVITQHIWSNIRMYTLTGTSHDQN